MVQAADLKHDDPNGTILPGANTAKEHGHRVARELRYGGYRPPGATLSVYDDTGRMIHSVPL